MPHIKVLERSLYPTILTVPKEVLAAPEAPSYSGLESTGEAEQTELPHWEQIHALPLQSIAAGGEVTLEGDLRVWVCSVANGKEEPTSPVYFEIFDALNLCLSVNCIST